MSWWPVVIVVLGCFGLKLAGTALPARIINEPRVAAMAALVPVALISAVIALQTLTLDHHYAIDARLAGVAVAVIAVARRAPFVVVVLLAAATTAVIRAAA